jgi:serine protease Do
MMQAEEQGLMKRTPDKTSYPVLLLVGSALAGTSVQALALPPDKVFEKVSKSVVVVLNLGDSGLQARGSGVVVEPQRVITNCHVLKKAKSVEVKLGETKYKAQLLFPDPDRDLCMLEVATLKAPFVDIAPLNTVRVGQKVLAVGSPEGLELSLSDGLISSLRGKVGEQILQTSAPISNGSSGGGLFDEDARLIGVTTASMVEGQNLNFAVPAEYIAAVPERGRKALAQLRQAAATASSTSPPSPSRSVSPSFPPPPRVEPAGVVPPAEGRLGATELAQHIMATRGFTGQLASGTEVQVEWTWGHGVAISTTRGVADQFSGVRTLDGDRICIRATNSFRPQTFGTFPGCYYIFKTGAKGFAWKASPTGGDSALTYQLP